MKRFFAYAIVIGAALIVAGAIGVFVFNAQGMALLAWPGMVILGMGLVFSFMAKGLDWY